MLLMASISTAHRCEAATSSPRKKIIISMVQKFPFIVDEIGSEHRRPQFAIVIDEAHSSQGGRTSLRSLDGPFDRRCRGRR